MLRAITQPEGYKLTALDGVIGHCRDFLFEDVQWTVRYMVADTGGWLSRRKVLISPVFLDNPEWETRRFPVRLTRRQIEDCPSLDADAPVSRRYERAYHEFFSMPFYWMGTGLWGNDPFPGTVMPPEVQASAQHSVEPRPDEPGLEAEVPQEYLDAVHLRSLREVTGYRVSAKDGDAGRIVDFVVDDRSWAMRYAVVDRSRLPFSRKVLIAVDWIDQVSWVDREVRVDLGSEQIAGAPEFDPRVPVNEELEVVLYDYYGRPRGRAADRP